MEDNQNNEQEKFNQIVKILSDAFKYHNINYSIEELQEIAQKYNNNINFCDAILANVNFNSKIELIILINLLSDFWYWVPRKELNGKSIAYSSIEIMNLGPIGRYLHGIKNAYVQKYISELPFQLKPEELHYFSKKISEQWLHTPHKELGGLSPAFLIEEEKKGNVKMEPTIDGFFLIHNKPLDVYNHLISNIKIPEEEKETIHNVIRNLDNYNDNQKIIVIKSWLEYIIDTQQKIKISDVDIFSASLEYLIQTKLLNNNSEESLKNLIQKYNIKKVNILKKTITNIEKYLKI